MRILESSVNLEQIKEEIVNKTTVQSKIKGLQKLPQEKVNNFFKRI